MAEIDDDTLGDAIGALNQAAQNNDEGTSEKIIRSEASTFGKRQKKPDPAVGAQKAYFTKIATIFGETFQKIKEANEKDTALQTQVADESADTSSPAKKTAVEVKKGKKASLGLIGTIIAIVGGIIAFGAFMKEKLGPLQERLLAALKFLRPVINFIIKLGDDIVKFFSKGKLFQVISKVPGIGKLFAGIGAKVGGKIAKVLKFIPFVGSLINFGFAIARFKSGDIFGGILEVLAGIGGLLPPPFFLIGMAIDGIILARDLIKAKKEKGPNVEEKEGEGGFLKKIASKIGEFISKNIKNLPVIGGAITGFEAIKAILGGDLSGGIKKFGKSILAFGLGAKGADMVIGAVGFVTDLFKSKDEGKVEEVPKSGTGGIKGMLKGVGGFIFKNLKNLPVIGGALTGFEASQAFLKGDFKGGLSLFGKSILAFGLGAKGADMVTGGIGFMLDFFNDTVKPAMISFPPFRFIRNFIGSIGEHIGKFFTNIKDAIFGFFDDWFSNFSFDNILETAKNAFGFIGNAISTVLGSIFGAIKNLGSFLLENIGMPGFKVIKGLFGALKFLLFGIPGKVFGMAKKVAGKAMKFVGGIVNFLTGKKEEEIEEDLNEGKSIAMEQEVTLPDFSHRLMEQLIHLQKMTAMLLTTNNTILRSIHTEMKTMNMNSDRLDRRLANNSNRGNNNIVSGGSARSSAPINNDGEILDSRADYGLSPYSISVA